MNKYLTAILFSFLFFFSCGENDKTALSKKNEYHIIPQPQSLSPKDGQFTINEKTTLIFSTEEAVQKLANWFLQKVEKGTGLQLNFNADNPSKNKIVLVLDKEMTAEEGYSLSVNADQIIAKAKNPIGLFYALQTLRQLLPPQFESGQQEKGIAWTVPALELSDAPRFPYRGMHLDVARHFFDVATVKQYIDQLAFHKLNYFHWHLTEDQGWRIEIKKYPKLTEIGGYRNGTLIGHANDKPHEFDGKRYGGFYTQEEIKEVVEYAATQFVTVVPEIELPGHAQAALTAYPELSCTDEPLEVWKRWGVSDNVFCPTEETFEFLENVLEEVIALFPGKYIHIGGDECPKTKWEESAFCQQLMRKEGLKDEHELQSYFIRRIEKFINSKGRQIIGWDEILEGGLAPNATVMSWRGISGGIEAAKSGHDVIMTPTSHCYFDYYQSDHPDEPLAIGGFLPLEKVYSYEPIPEELNEAEAKYVLGAQANVWTEYIPTTKQLEYMTFPRMCALAEVVWSKKEARDFDNFLQRVYPHLTRLQKMGIEAANHFYDVKASIQPNEGKVEVKFNTLAPDAEIYYTLDGSEPSSKSMKYETSVKIEKSSQIKAGVILEDRNLGRKMEQTFDIHKAAGKKITLSTTPHPKYRGDGNASIINGVLGSDERYGDKEWLGFDGEDLEAIIDLGEEKELTEASLRFFKGEAQWIYLPSKVELSVSQDGKTYEKVGAANKIEGETKVVETKIALTQVKGRYVKASIKNYGKIPADREGGGHASWLFVDEIRIR